MKKILSVDDSAMVRKIMRAAAESLGYELLEASDGVEALEVLNKEYLNTDLILLDWNMPYMNGMEFLKVVKSKSEYRHIPIMMVTTETEKENIVRAIQHGADHYMVKPFSMEELVKKMLECLGKGEHK